MRFVALISALALLASAGLPFGTFELRFPDSRVEFVVKDNRGGFTGTVRDITATVGVREQNAGAYLADVVAKIDARTIKTGSSLRDTQMRSARFLDTDEFPFITFVGTAEAESPLEQHFKGTLRGRLTIKNVTRAVEIPLDVTPEENGYLARGEAMVRMTDFSIPIPRFLIFVAEDPVVVKLQIRLSARNSSP